MKWLLLEVGVMDAREVQIGRPNIVKSELALAESLRVTVSRCSM